MELTQFTFRLLLLFLPGVACLLIVEQLTVHRDLGLPRLVMYALLLGFLCHLTYYALSLARVFPSGHQFFDAMVDEDVKPDLLEILWASVFSVPVGIIASFCINRGILHWLGRKTRASQKFADPDVWGYAMSSALADWVILRDTKTDTMYRGFVVAYSDTNDERELLLRDVKVYVNSTGRPVYEIPWMYLSRPRLDLQIDFTKQEAELGTRRFRKGKHHHG